MKERKEKRKERERERKVDGVQRLEIQIIGPGGKEWTKEQH